METRGFASIFRDVFISVLSSASVNARRGLTRAGGFFFLSGGLFGMVSVLIHGLGTPQYKAIAAIGVVVILGGPLLLVTGRSIARDSFHVLMALGTGLVTATVQLAGGGIMSLSYTVGYFYVILVAAFFFTWAGVALQTALVLVCGTIALHNVGMPTEAIVPMVGAWVTMAAVVAALAREAHAVEEDPLTALPNRRGFDWRLEEALEGDVREHYQLSLILLGLDHFKRVNDTDGARAGDQLLSSVAAGWHRQLTHHQTLCRYGGDVFAVLLPGMSLGRAADLADAMRAAVQPQLTVSAGVATWVPGDSASMLVSRADVALFEAKSAGRDQTVVYGDPKRGASELEAAISNGEMRLFFQPIVRLGDRRVVSAESLVRWEHPRKGLVGPAEFVQQAERTGAIHSLGAWTLDEACRMAAHRAAELGLQTVSVNVSVPELRSPGYPALLRRTLHKHDLDPSQLVVEITEAVFDGGDPQLVQTLEQIRALGVGVAIDDFGSGYSSLRWVDSLPLDVMKIDASFVWAIPEDSDHAPVLEAMIAMGQALGKRVIAEGVETEHQAEVLQKLGCELGQGYLFARPAPVG